VRPGVDLRDQVEDDLVWIRSGFLEDTRDHGALVVHGHTALDEVTHHGNRLNIDSGAAYGRALSAVVIEDGKSYLLTPKGRVALG
jgi:serine/threonine protein phosphatase 1